MGENTIALDIDKHSLKIGDGIHKWSELKNWGGGSGVPIRTIVAWGGPTNEIPEGWALCDGRTLNGITTPNLVGKFIRGANNSGATGGKNSVSVTLTTENMPSHNHSFTGASHSHSGGSHSHSISISGSSGSAGAHTHRIAVLGLNSGTTPQGAGATVRTQKLDRYDQTLSDGAHTHTISISGSSSAASINTSSVAVSGTISTVGSGSPFTIQTVPEYYELCFIMKVSDD